LKESAGMERLGAVRVAAGGPKRLAAVGRGVRLGPGARKGRSRQSRCELGRGPGRSRQSRCQWRPGARKGWRRLRSVRWGRGCWSEM
jgi:hypothetical protein